MRHSFRANRPPVQVISFPSSSSSARGTRLRKRYWLSALAILFVVVMVVGIVFVAHKAYHDLGGQGFLKTRRSLLSPVKEDALKVYLPLRKVESCPGEESLLVYGVGYMKRSPEYVPFYACGDQEHSCEAFGQPAICCPVQMTCYPTSIDVTPSKIFCCNSTTAFDDCIVSQNTLPKCLPGTIQCSENAGGGCCPESTLCSPNGCIQSSGPSIISASAAVTGTPAPINGIGGSPVILTTTVTEKPAATATILKEGEIAPNAAGKRSSITMTLCLPYSLAWTLVCVMAVMGFL